MNPPNQSPLSTDVSENINNANNEDNSFQVRIRSLPVLSKQSSGNMPVSARGDNQK